jgi:putative peptide zinc metalloprotease protein
MSTPTDGPVERRKQVRLKVRPDLQHVEQRYEGKRFHVVKDPVCLRYYRFNQQEYFVFSLFDGGHSMEDVRTRFEDEFKPHRLEFQDLEAFARQLVTAGLVQHEQAGTGKHLFQRRAKQRRMQKFAALSNILYYKIPVFDPDRLLTWMYKWLWWIFTWPFFFASIGLMLAALFQVTVHFQTFYDKMPAYQEFFAYKTVLYMWLSLGVVKVIHEFGHGLSCKAFKGECHEMGVLLMCFSPALYANVTDAWTVADKWKRIVISFAGIYVELVIAAIATFVWWYTPHLPVVNNVAMCLMVLCSVSTVVFNANPLMRFDGYYMLADWLEIPNLRDRANKYLNNLFLSKCLGVETPPEPYMAPSRRALFVAYAVGSWVYRWVVTFGIIWFLSGFLDPKLKVLSRMLAFVSLASMFVWPVFRMIKNVRQRGRLPDMKKNRVYVTLAVAVLVVLLFAFLPLPVSRVVDTGLVALDPAHATPLTAPEESQLLEVKVREGDRVTSGRVLAEFRSLEFEKKLDELDARIAAAESRVKKLKAEASTADPASRDALTRQVSQAENELDGLKTERDQDARRAAVVNSLVSPRSGFAMGVPRTADVGKRYDGSDRTGRTVMTVGDPEKLIVKLPVSSPTYRLLQEDLPSGGELAVEVHVSGRHDRVYTGRIRRLPPVTVQEGQRNGGPQIPMQLTQRGGGPLAVTQGGADGQEVTPVSPTYLVEVEILDPDASIRPGTLVSVKVFCQWRSGAWWVIRKLAEATDVGLYQ